MHLTLSLDETPILDIDLPLGARPCLSDCMLYLYAHNELIDKTLLSHSRLLSHFSRLKKGLKSTFTTLYRIKTIHAQCHSGSPGPSQLEQLFYQEAGRKGLVALYSFPGDRIRNLNSVKALPLDDQMLLARAVNIVEPGKSAAMVMSQLEEGPSTDVYQHGDPQQEHGTRKEALPAPRQLRRNSRPWTPDISPSQDIEAFGVCTSSAPLGSVQIPPYPERPVALNNSSMGRVEIVLQQIERYIDGRMWCATDVSAGTLLGPEQEKNAFDLLRTMQDKLIYGVGILVQKPTPQAWQFINEGCQIMDGVLLQQSRSMIRLLLRTFGGEGWDRLPMLRACLLRHFGDISAVRLGRRHPLSIVLLYLQDKDVIEGALEQAFLVLLDTLEKKLTPADNEIHFLRVDLCFLLRERQNYTTAERYGLRFLTETERIHGRSHVATRGFLLKVGDIYLHQKLYEQAIQVFNDVLDRSNDALGTDLDITGLYAHRNLGWIYEELKHDMTSEYHWKAVVGGALRIWGVGTEKFMYFAAQARESMCRQGFNTGVWMKLNFAIDE